MYHFNNQYCFLPGSVNYIINNENYITKQIARDIIFAIVMNSFTKA